jgi:hypothetical protein
MLRRIVGVGLVPMAVVVVLAGGGRGDERPAAKAEVLDDLVKRWTPDPEGAEVAKYGGAIKDAKAPFRPRVAAHTFDVTGATFEAVWNHYADRCGAKERFDPRQVRQGTWQGADGKPSYVIAERETRAGERVSVFTYRGGGHTASVSIQPRGDGKTVLCILTVVVEE